MDVTEVRRLDAVSAARGFKQGHPTRVSERPEFFNEAQAQVFVDVTDAVLAVEGASCGTLVGPESDFSREMFVARDGVRFKVTVEAVV